MPNSSHTSDHSQPLVSVIVPTKNSALHIVNFLDSFIGQTSKQFEIIINDDQTSNDHIEEVVEQFKNKGLPVKLIRENISMAQARKQGVARSTGEILLHLDSDMRLESNLIAECIELMKSNDAVVIPEISIASNFVGRCKAVEKQCYQRVQFIESLRCISRRVYDEVGGHDVSMVFSEDKDLDIRVRQTGAKVARSTSGLTHNEGAPTLRSLLAKKSSYSSTASLFQAKHPKEFRQQANPFNRYLLFAKRADLLFQYPLEYIALWPLKTAEYIVSANGYRKHLMRRT